LTIAAFISGGIGPGSTIPLYLTDGLGIGDAIVEPPAPPPDDGAGSGGRRRNIPNAPRPKDRLPTPSSSASRYIPEPEPEPEPPPAPIRRDTNALRALVVERQRLAEEIARKEQLKQSVKALARKSAEIDRKILELQAKYADEAVLLLLLLD